MVKRLYIITNKYPNSIDPNALVFLQQLVWEFADQGVECSVICPLPINLNPMYVKIPFKSIEKTENGAKINVYFPKYIGFGQTCMMGYNPVNFTTNNFTSAVSRVIKLMEKQPDALYGHFITPAGIAAARLGSFLNIPSFLSYGESSLWSISNFGINNVILELKNLSGIISVSKYNKNKLIQLGISEENKIGVFPNGIRKKRFYPRDKVKARKKHGISNDRFIVAFVGHFIKRKGIDKLIQAIENLDNIFVIYAGKGKLIPKNKKTLFYKSINQVDLPWFYSAADVFVLPTLDEGCCNAIIEAMACGLPIISSNLPFNDDILDDTCSIRINPLKVDEISKAINTLYKNRELLYKLHLGSIKKAKSLTLDKRAHNIIRFINEKM
jgi:teichuronic acid biosynthesis glycosyltransferase TuaC